MLITCRAGHWHAASNLGIAASGVAGAAGVPAVGGQTASPYQVPFDMRLEFEFVGSNPIGLWIGTSITNGTQGQE